MRKLLTAGIFGTILSLTGANYACASIISRGFFDEAMENYATNTALDLKANQTDLTALSNKIGTLPSVILPSMWTDIPYYTQEGKNIPDAGIPLPTTIGEQLEFLFGGEIDSPIDRMFRVITLAGEAFPVGTIDPGNNDPRAEFLGLNPLTQKVRSIDDKIGTVPTETAMSSCSVWRAIDLTQNEMPETIGGILDQLYSAGHRNGSCTHDGYNGPSLPNIIGKLIYGYNYNGGTEMLGINGLNVGLTDSTGNVIEPGLRQITNGWTDAKGGIIINPGLKGMYDGWTNRGGDLINPGIKGMFEGWTSGDYTFPGLFDLSSNEMKFTTTFGAPVSSILRNGLENFTSPEYTGPLYPLWKLSQGIDQIGTLPSGRFPMFPGFEFLFSELDKPLTYPTSLAELINAIYGDAKNSEMGLLKGIIAGFPYDFDQDARPQYIGLIPNYNLAKAANDKIGTLPSGNLRPFSGAESLFSALNQPLTYPTSLAELITAIYGGTNTPGLLAGITVGFPFDFDRDGHPDDYIGLQPNYLLAKDAHDKIGTLPSGNLPQVPEYNDIFPLNNLPTTYPTSLSELITVLFGDGKTQGGIIDKLIGGLNTRGLFYYETAGILPAMQAATTANAKIGTVPDGKNLAGMISETDAKIGTVPAGYDNVGAALTAMKSDIDAKNLPSTSDDGQYVLTAKKVGETITYTWVKMDLTTEEQGQ